jgi:phosphoribosylglycinamide formyltransferase 1
MAKIKLALFASGSGSNALKIMDFFSDSTEVEVTFLLCNKKDAPIVKLAGDKQIEVFVFSNEEVENGFFLVDFCQKKKIDVIILAGYLRKIPSKLIQNFPERIINIHPSLLPKHGGKGMYGKFVHEAVLKNKDTETGITIHFVNEEFDKGRIIAQYSCAVSSEDTLEDVQRKIQELEHTYFSEVIANTLNHIYHV